MSDLSAAWQLVSKLENVFPDLLQTLRVCPVPDCPIGDEDHSVLYVVMHLNDEHRWSRERTADFLEGLDIDLTFPVPSDL